MKHSHLGFVDWGIGGLTVLSEVLKLQPQLQITYFSDAGFTPYGKMSAQDLTLRLFQIFEWLKKQGCDGIVVACNAASAALLKTSPELLQNNFDTNTPIYDVITPTLSFLKKSSYQRLGIIGGDATVQSHIYRDSNPLQNVFEQSAQPLSALIEEGKLSDDDVMPLLKTIFKNLEDKNLQALVLACTHYPAVAPHILKLQPTWQHVDPAVVLAKKLSAKLIPSAQATKKFYTTGSAEQTIFSAQKAFQFFIDEVTVLSLG